MSHGSRVCISQRFKRYTQVTNDALHVQHVNDDIRKTMEAIEIQSQQLLGSRRPLQKVKITKEIKQFNPRFEEDFAQEKDYDVDRQALRIMCLLKSSPASTLDASP